MSIVSICSCPRLGTNRSYQKQREGGKSMRKIALLSVLMIVAAGLILTGCSKVKGQAEAALKAAEKVVSEAKPEAEKIVPDQLKALEAALNGAKEKFGKGDYKAALSDAQAIPGKVKDMLASLNAKKDELTKTWTNLDQGIPKMMDAIKSRVGILSQSKKLPANLTKEKFEEAKSGLDSALKDWETAKESFKGGMMGEAVAKGNTVKEKAVQILQILGMPVPAAAKS
jgi:HEPN domain-containing protein